MGNNKISDKPVEIKITDEAIAKAKTMIGVKLRTEQYLRDASIDTIANFSNGIGDLNPLYRDAEYGRWTRFGSMVAHPFFPYTHHWPGRSRWGLPGVHGFYAGNDWEFFKAIKPGDRINCYERVAGVEEKQGKFSGRLVIQYVENTFTNQRDEIVAKALGWFTRHERKAARDQGKYSDIKTHVYSDEEYEEIYRQSINEQENIRGNQTRYWEDVEVDEELPSIVRGPLSLMDTMGFVAGCGRSHTHGVLLKGALKHPGHYFKSQEAGGGIEYTGIGHHRESTAKNVGVPGTYDYGPQRTAWLGSLVTNWMGDDAYLKRLRAEMRRFNIMGDTTWCKGKVSKKYVKDGYALVDIEIFAVNQREEITAPGTATVMLPSRSLENNVVIDGSFLNLELPIVR